ncbi:MAG: dyp-type peroxidase [Gemmatimonadota bacterium]|nr:dyp-type peroxidase [Gemmatimonadota bacterium]
MRTLILDCIEHFHVDQSERAITLDLPDIQSFILYPVGFPHARFSFFHIDDAARGRAFVAAVAELVSDATLPPFVDGKPVPKPSEVTVAFTYRGLAALEVPEHSLHSFPQDFAQGMRARARELLADRGANDPEHWEQVWRTDRVHVWVAVQANTLDELTRLQTRVLECARANGVELLEVQESQALVTKPGGDFTSKEHFGYTDGIGDPEIEGSGWPRIRGRGKWDEKRNDWVPIAAGEFVLGYRDEAGELPRAPLPIGLARNGSFMVYRKLHQNVAKFRAFIQGEGAKFAGGPEFLAAKLMGRWRNGTPLIAAPDAPAEGAPLPEVPQSELTNFRYNEDKEGGRCPMGSHIRRANPRDSLGFHGVLVDQRRIVRRGVPYGTWIPETTPLDEAARLDHFDDEHPSQHGVVFMAINASIERQFEFVQREWMNYGNDFRQGNDRDPITGARDADDRMVIQGSIEKHTRDDRDVMEVRPPHICRGLEQFAVTRGGAYFFLPGLTALRLIGAGRVESA